MNSFKESKQGRELKKKTYAHTLCKNEREREREREGGGGERVEREGGGRESRERARDKENSICT